MKQQSFIFLTLLAFLSACTMQAKVNFLDVEKTTVFIKTLNPPDAPALRVRISSDVDIFEELDIDKAASMNGFWIYECGYDWEDPFTEEQENLRPTGTDIRFESETEDGFIYSTSFATKIYPGIIRILENRLDMCGRYRLGGMPGVQLESNEIKIPYNHLY